MLVHHFRKFIPSNRDKLHYMFERFERHVAIKLAMMLPCLRWHCMFPTGPDWDHKLKIAVVSFGKSSVRLWMLHAKGIEHLSAESAEVLLNKALPIETPEKHVVWTDNLQPIINSLPLNQFRLA